MGSHLCEALVRAGATVRVMDNFTSGRTDNLLTVNAEMEMLEGNVTDEKLIKDACRGINAVIHTAFPMAARERSLETCMAADFTAGLLNLLKASAENNSLFIYISSIAVYGDQKFVPLDESHPLEPIMLHGAMKVSGEFYCRAMAKSNGLKYVILRVADIYGPRNTRISVPVRFLLNALKGEPLMVFGSGRQTRTYTYVDDFVGAVLGVLETPAAEGGTFNIAGDQYTTLYELAVLANEIAGAKSQIVMNEKVASDERVLIIDGALARRTLNLGKSVSIGEGLARTKDWLIENPYFYPTNSTNPTNK